MAKIAVDARVVTDRPVGVARYASQLALHLPSLGNDEFFYIVNTPVLERWLASYNVIGNCRFVYARSRPLSLLEHLEIPWLLRRHRVDLFHATSYMTPIWVSCRSVYTIHDTFHLLFPQGFSRFATLYYRIVVKTAARNADAILTVSQSSHADIKRLVTRRTPIYVTPEGYVPREAASNIPFDVLRNRYSIPAVGYFLYMGNRRYHKNSSRVLDAYRGLCEKLDDVPPLVLNLPPTPERLARVAETRAAARTHFIGFVDDAHVPALYRNALCLVAPSLCEGFGLFLLEAMAEDTPVITSNLSSMPEVAGDAALFVDPYNTEQISEAMQKMTQDEVLRRDLVERGRKRLSLFSWAECARQTYEIYDKALGRA